ncbi:MAG TPA: hypothetical protein VJ949_06260 [Cryomorphaceae bacterium]|nr:hypothetical protein [Cryomorphaceae bacterium]
MPTFRKIACLFVFLTMVFSVHAQPMDSDESFHDKSNEHDQQDQQEFLVNLKLFFFDSSLLDPWIEEITHIRVYGLDFKKSKDSDGLYQYVDDGRMNEFISFTNEKNLKVIWTLNVTSFTLEQEMEYVKDIISRGLNIVGFEYGGEYYLRKYYFGDLSAKGVVEKIRMDGENQFYLELLDMWLPPFTSEFPMDKYEHIIITASTNKEKHKEMDYRREFNRKVFEYVDQHPEYDGKVSYSYHLYAGAKSARYNQHEEKVLTPDEIDWSFLEDKPEGSRWVVTESGYYITDYSPQQLKIAKKFYVEQSRRLDDESLLGIHELIEKTKRFNPLSLYGPQGMTPVGEMVEDWLSNRAAYDAGILEVDINDEDNSESPVQQNQESIQESGAPTLVDISPEYKGWFQWIHFSHTLTFSNGKSYRRSYWFSSPDFRKDDLGKPLSYFKRVVKSS